jgi:hypothetical protein
MRLRAVTFSKECPPATIDETLRFLRLEYNPQFSQMKIYPTKIMWRFWYDSCVQNRMEVLV